MVMEISSRYVIGYTLAWKGSREVVQNLIRESRPERVWRQAA
jgi:hypothetical protein